MTTSIPNSEALSVALSADPSALWPVFALAAWTLIVLLRLAWLRVRSVRAGENRIRDYRIGQPGSAPDHVQQCSRNYANLLELPILFYVISLLIALGPVQLAWGVTLQWAYVALRVVHSVIHLNHNDVTQRFAVFASSNVVLTILWVMTGIALAR